LVKDVFKIFDKDGNKTIDRSEAQKHWSQVRFGKISANEFFNTVDFNNDGEITEEEFLPNVTSSKFVLCNFYHQDFERCKIMDMHLRKIAAVHTEAKFVTMNAEKAPFFIKKLQI